MARLVGVDLPRDKRVEVALTYIFGVGRTRSKEALVATGVDPNTRVKDLGETELVALRDFLEGNYRLEGDLRDRLLRRSSSPSWSARARSAHQDQRAHPQGPEAHRGRQEEGQVTLIASRSRLTDIQF
jgi:hypothetical protein